MIITLANGKAVHIEDVVKDPKAEAIKWLEQYRESHKESPGRTQASATPISSQERSTYNGRKDCTTD